MTADKTVKKNRYSTEVDTGNPVHVIIVIKINYTDFRTLHIFDDNFQCLYIRIDRLTEILPMLLADGLSSLMVMLQADFGSRVIKLYPVDISGLVKMPEIKRHVLLSPPHTPHPSNLFCPPIEPSQLITWTKKKVSVKRKNKESQLKHSHLLHFHLRFNTILRLIG